MPKVLFVDDDEQLRTVVSDWLEHERFIVDLAGDGNEGKEKLAFSTYDLIVLDWNLPGMSGIEICRWFREQGGNTPVLMLTGKDQIEDKETGFDAGADDYLTKPFQIRELIARLNALQRRGGMVTPTRNLQIGTLVLDPVGHCAKIDGKNMQLTPTEFDILEFFLRHPDQVFSAETLIDRLWKDGASVSPDNVRVYIKRLRSKLELFGHGALLKNVHSVGYKLSAEE